MLQPSKAMTKLLPEKKNCCQKSGMGQKKQLGPNIKIRVKAYDFKILKQHHEIDKVCSSVSLLIISVSITAI